MHIRHVILCSLVLVSLLLSACATRVEVDGKFPAALIHKLPLRSIVVFDEAFANYRFESTEGPEVSISVGQIQVELFTSLTDSLFQYSATTTQMPTNSEADLIIVPNVEDVQISMPNQSRLKVFEVWIKYNLQVFEGTGEPVADWIMTAYGKTPTRFLKSDTEALQQASMVAMRDAGAHFITGFARVPEIRQWLRHRSTPTSTTTPTTEVNTQP